MKKIEYEHIQIPRAVVNAAQNVKEIPRTWYGMDMEYRYIVYPERKNDMLILRAYDVQKIKEGFEYYEETAVLTEEESWILFVYNDKDRWVTFRREQKDIWGKASLKTLMGWIGLRNDIKLINPSVVKKDERFNTNNPVKAIYDWQERIKNKNLNQRQQKKDEITIAIMEQEIELPKDYLKWQEETVMKKSRYIIYKRSGRKKYEAFCTHCKEHIMIDGDKCHHNEKGRCPSCGSSVTMKASGRVKHLIDESWTQFVQAYDNGLMIRYFNMGKSYSEYGNPQMYFYETARAVIEKGKEAKWYEKRSCNTRFSSSSTWQKNNVCGTVIKENCPKINSIDKIYKKGLTKELKKAFPYNMFSEYKGRHAREPWAIYDYFNVLSQYPLLESLEKTGKTKLVDDVVLSISFREKINKKAKKVNELLGITRQQYKEIGNCVYEFVEFVQMFNTFGCNATMEQIKQLSKYETWNFKTTFPEVLKFTTVHKFLKYAKKYNPVTIKDFYFDYINMAMSLGYDMKNTFVLFPKHLREAHDQAQEEKIEREEAKKLKEASKRDADIAKIEKKIRKAFSFENDQYLIRPAKTNVEIVKEGQKQHICVGNGNYSNEMAKGKSYILFLRRKEEPGVPFYTVQIKPDFHIIQWHGKNNRENIEHDEVKAFLDEFVAKKAKKKKKAS